MRGGGGRRSGLDDVSRLNGRAELTLWCHGPGRTGDQSATTPSYDGIQISVSATPHTVHKTTQTSWVWFKTEMTTTTTVQELLLVRNRAPSS